MNNWSRFENLFTSLSENSKKLRVQSYGLSDTSLEEIFLQVSKHDEVETEKRTRLTSTSSSTRGVLKMKPEVLKG